MIVVHPDYEIRIQRTTSDQHPLEEQTYAMDADVTEEMTENGSNVKRTRITLAIVFDNRVREGTVNGDVVLPGTILIAFASEIVG